MTQHSRRRSSAPSSTPSAPATTPAAPVTRGPEGPATGPESSSPTLDHAAEQGGTSGGSMLQDIACEDQDAFSERFNEHFAAQLHVFASDDAREAAEAGPNVNAAGVTRASGDGVCASRLRTLFTEGQRRMLSDYFASNRIPSRLFNGDEVGTTSAQQRIVLSGHILAHGEYVPGSFAQRMHARMCGHWANLVMHYAGAGSGAGSGIREQFDHEGNLSISTGERSGQDDEGEQRSWTGSRIQDDEYEEGDVRPERSRYQLHGLPMDRLNQLQAGDWLWYFNDNGGAGGNHSVIFSRWASDEVVMREGGAENGPVINRYRRAICMSQRNPANGGVEHTSLLGERFMRNEENHRITPVTHFSRVDADARPVRTADDLREVLGSSGAAARNQRFVDGLMRRHPGMRIDWDALATDIRARNDALLQQLRARHASRMSDGLDSAIEDLNRAALTDNGQNADITTLCGLNNRLRTWLSNADTLGEGEEGQRSRVEGNRQRAEQEHGEEREDLQNQIAAIEEEIDGYEQVREQAAARSDQLDLRDEERAANRAVAASRGRRREARQAVRHNRDDSQTERLEQELATALDAERSAVEEAARMRAQRREQWGDVRALRQQSRRQNGLINRAERQRDRLQTRLDRLMGGRSSRYMVHNADRGAFQGRGETRAPRQGLLSNLDPQPSWSSLMIPAEGEG